MTRLKNNFAVPYKVNHADGSSEFRLRWTNADAEQQYLKLKEIFQKLKEEQEKRGLNGNDK